MKAYELGGCFLCESKNCGTVKKPVYLFAVTIGEHSPVFLVCHDCFNQPDDVEKRVADKFLKRQASDPAFYHGEEEADGPANHTKTT